MIAWNPSSIYNDRLFLPEKPRMTGSHTWRGFKMHKNMENKGTKLEFNTATKQLDLTFERILTDANQEETFQSVKPFVLSALDGKPVGIFAYGATGSGKSFTMLGDSVNDTEEGEGIIPRVVREVATHPDIESAYYEAIEISIAGTDFANFKYLIFDISHENNLFYTLQVLPESDKTGDAVNVQRCVVPDGWEDKYSVTSANCHKHNASILKYDAEHTFQPVVIKSAGESGQTFNPTAFKKKIKEIESRRRTAWTAGNPNGSSRTHLLTTIICKKKDDGPECRIYLMDLAGHEAIGESKGEEEKLSKGISQSLNHLTGFMRIAQKRAKGKTNAMMKKRNSDLTGGIAPSVSPLIALTHKIWTVPEGKLMMLACVNPLSQSLYADSGRWRPEIQKPPNPKLKNRKAVVYTDLEIEGKLTRDGIVLDTLSEMQKELAPSKLVT